MRSRFQIVSIIFFCFTILLPSLSFGKDHSNHELTHKNTGVEALSPELRALLTTEMLALQKGMMAIIPAYISGNWSEIAHIADKMQNSYILKQSLTEQQMNELHNALSDSFIKLDQQFHYLSGMLNHAAKKEKSELVGFYFSKMTETCVSCHTQHAIHKFPSLAAPPQKTNKHSH